METTKYHSSFSIGFLQKSAGRPAARGVGLLKTLIHGLGFRVQGLGFRVLGLGVLGFRSQGLVSS